MNHSEPRIPKKLAPEVFAIASRLYAEEKESYSVSELIEIGAEVNIPPDYIHQALEEVQAQKIEAHQRSKRGKKGAIMAGIAIAFLGWLAISPIPEFSCHGSMGQADHSTMSLR